MGKTVWPASGEPRKIRLEAKDAVPGAEEVKRLSAIPFDRQKAGAAEVNEGLKWFAIGIIGAIVLWFFGGWVISKFRGLGVLIFGYGFRYIGCPVILIYGIYSLAKIFRSARKKTAEDALKWVWMTGLLGDDTAADRFGKTEYALSALRRAIPSALPFDMSAVAEGIDRTRLEIAKAADITAAAVREQNPGWMQTGPLTSINIIEAQEVAPGAKQVHAVISYRDRLTKTVNNNTDYMIAAQLTIDVKQVFICSGGYWFPCELIPEISITE